MLSNQISTRDLFSYPLRQGSQDSSSQGTSDYLRGESGFQDSQSQPCIGSLSQPDIYSPGRRMFQKYSSRGSIFKLEGNLPSSQQDLQRSKAREREDREFMQNMMSVVSESSSAVRFALESFRDSLETKQGKNEENVATSLQALSDEVQRNAEKIISAICEQDKVKQELHQLNIELSKKDAIINGLKNQLKENKEQDNEKIMEIVKNSHMQQQDIIEDKLQKLLSVTSEQLKLYDKQISWQADQEKGHAEFQKEMLNEQQNLLKGLEDKLLSELSNVQHQLSVKQSQLGNYYRQQLQEYNRQQTKTVESCLRQPLEENVKNASRETNSLLSQQRQEIELACNRHRLELQRFIKSELTKQMFENEKNIKQIVSNVKSLHVVSNQSENGALNVARQQRSKVMNTSKRTWMTLPLCSPKPTQVGEDEDEENSEYGCDVERITVSSPEFHISPYNYSEQGVQPSKKDLLGSPWNPNTLFQRSRTVKPSPVAKVAPMAQQSSSKNMSNHSTVMRTTTNKEQERENQKKQEGTVYPQRPSKQTRDLQKFSKTTPPEQTSRYLTRSSKRQQDSMCEEEKRPLERSYDMGEGEQQERKNHPNKRKAKAWDENEPQWLKVARLKENRSTNTVGQMPGRETSPPMATMKMVMKRKVRCRRTPSFVTEISRTKWSRSNMESEDTNRTFDDLLSSPCFKFCDTLNEPFDDRALVLEGKVSRKNANKRKLCEVNYDTQITEITQAIKQQLQYVNTPSFG
ncbi:putative autophagy-related protein 11 isoform X2 [Liolophura sinensis]|uniref:putative autophagy-related protein 11 isoform X2 n=1 Tax=Liolophura sinensis TaxID=3198878 RepID=UPI0031591E36